MRPTGAAAQGPPLLLALLAACAIAGRCDGRVQQTPTAYANDSPLTERGASAAASAAPTAPLMVVDLRKATLQAKVAVQVCAGLFNRDPGVTGAAYTILGQDDLSWLQEVEGIVNPALTPVPVFLSRCLAGPQATAKGYIRYNASLQKPVMPNLATLAAVLDAVPLEDGDPAIGAATLVFDALKMFANFTALQATEYMWANHVNETSTMAKTNPGYVNQTNHPFNPPLVGEINPGLFDYIVKERLFNFYLNLGCIPSTAEYELEVKIVQNNPWPRPIGVMGYENSFPVAGDIFEAETDCNRVHNMGQIASDGCNNLGYWSSKPAISAPLSQVDQGTAGFVYNTSKTYVSIIVGDGDNINYVKGGRREWMLERVANCAAGKGCFPLVWSMSPHTLHLAPDWLRWYYNKSHETGNDFFCLPPSGHLYSYPGEFAPATQASFVLDTEHDCHLMNSSGSVAWEFFDGWAKAIDTYFPRYAANGIMRAFFAVNVPFMFPVQAFKPEEHYKIFGGKVALFKPQEWRGTTCESITGQCATASEMAGRLNGFPPGTVTHIYVTSDGGANLQDLYDMVANLGEHVEVVNQEVVALAALQRG